MYRIIGGDGREYGPISLDQMRQWIAEGRVNAQTSCRDPFKVADRQRFGGGIKEEAKGQNKGDPDHKGGKQTGRLSRHAAFEKADPCKTKKRKQGNQPDKLLHRGKSNRKRSQKSKVKSQKLKAGALRFCVSVVKIFYVTPLLVSRPLLPIL